ncbi:glycosyltransferase [Lacrimispora sp.]|uniref:glycosyltransferase n=1 Tax=Lacrimispora sp. TaxID=2719234 RepID=UPI0032E42D1D
MKILHYFLGFPPYRTGGLTKYSMDLMNAQIERGNIVIALWPGTMKKLTKNISIQQNKSVNKIINFELINPLPVSLDEGIVKFDAYMQSCDENIFVEFLKKISPDVIHIHTLMGLYREFVYAANKLNIKTVFTTHDYFGICSKVTLYKNGCACENDNNCFDCIACNESALSLKKIRVMQSPLYRKLKDFVLVKKLRRNHRKKFFSEKELLEKKDNDKIKNQAENYQKLRLYYIDILTHIDVIHYNSTLTKDVFERFLIPKDSKIISITHKDISDNRRSKKTKSHILRLTCLAPTKAFKGFTVMKTALDELWENGNHSFELKLFDQVQNPSPYMKIKENGYNYNELPQILAETDLVLAPSVWYETFGFTVLEAISYGVPVIISNNIGAKDIIGNGGIVVQAGSVQSLKDTISSLNDEIINNLVNNIRENVTVKTWDQFLDENENLYIN